MGILPNRQNRSLNPSAFTFKGLQKTSLIAPYSPWESPGSPGSPRIISKPTTKVFCRKSFKSAREYIYTGIQHQLMYMRFGESPNLNTNQSNIKSLNSAQTQKRTICTNMATTKNHERRRYRHKKTFLLRDSLLPYNTFIGFTH